MARQNRIFQLDDDALWYKDAIIYEMHVRAFYDSDGDGIGDFRGITEKLDYLQDLGVTAIWLLPFYPSPLKDDGYDIADYTDIHPNYGTLKDFRAFLREAKYRGLRVITELVLNHTSDEHEWAQKARQGDEKYQDYYYVFPNREIPDMFEETMPEVFPETAPGNFTWIEGMDKWVMTVFKNYPWFVQNRMTSIISIKTDGLL